MLKLFIYIRVPLFSTEDEVLYQNYQEKALHNDSDEDAESREPKADESIVVQYKPIRTSWSQLSVVRCNKNTFFEHIILNMKNTHFITSQKPDFEYQWVMRSKYHAT